MNDVGNLPVSMYAFIVFCFICVIFLLYLFDPHSILLCIWPYFWWRDWNDSISVIGVNRLVLGYGIQLFKGIGMIIGPPIIGNSLR